MKDQPKHLFIQSLKIGGLLGLAGIIITLLIYVLNINMLSIGFGILFLVVNLTISVLFLIYGMRDIRDNFLNGSITYWNKVVIGFIIGLLGGWVSGIFGMLLFSYYDPAFAGNQIEQLLIKLEEMGLDETVLLKQEQRIKEGFTVAGQLKSLYLRTPIFALIISLVVAAFVKKEKNSTNQEVF